MKNPKNTMFRKKNNEKSFRQMEEKQLILSAKWRSDYENGKDDFIWLLIMSLMDTMSIITRER